MKEFMMLLAFGRGQKKKRCETIKRKKDFFAKSSYKKLMDEFFKGAFVH
jgi:hypothetical protein